MSLHQGQDGSTGGLNEMSSIGRLLEDDDSFDKAIKGLADRNDGIGTRSGRHQVESGSTAMMGGGARQSGSNGGDHAWYAPVQNPTLVKTPQQRMSSEGIQNYNEQEKSFVRECVALSDIDPRDNVFINQFDVDRAVRALDYYEIPARSISAYNGHERKKPPDTHELVNKSRRGIWNNAYLSYDNRETSVLRSAGFIHQVRDSHFEDVSEWVAQVDYEEADHLLIVFPKHTFNWFMQEARHDVAKGVNQEVCEFHVNRMKVACDRSDDKVDIALASAPTPQLPRRAATMDHTGRSMLPGAASPTPAPRTASVPMLPPGWDYGNTWQAPSAFAASATLSRTPPQQTSPAFVPQYALLRSPLGPGRLPSGSPGDTTMAGAFPHTPPCLVETPRREGSAPQSSSRGQMLPVGPQPIYRAQSVQPGHATPGPHTSRHGYGLYSSPMSDVTPQPHLNTPTPPHQQPWRSAGANSSPMVGFWNQQGSSPVGQSTGTKSMDVSYVTPPPQGPSPHHPSPGHLSPQWMPQNPVGPGSAQTPWGLAGGSASPGHGYVGISGGFAPESNGLFGGNHGSYHQNKKDTATEHQELLERIRQACQTDPAFQVFMANGVTGGAPGTQQQPPVGAPQPQPPQGLPGGQGAMPQALGLDPATMQFLAAINMNAEQLMLEANRQQELRMQTFLTTLDRNRQASPARRPKDDILVTYRLKAEEVGFFEPKDAHDQTATQIFLNVIEDALLRHEPQDLLPLLRVCTTKKSSIAYDWYHALDEAERKRMTTSVEVWKKALRTDRTPAQYVNTKLRLLRNAGWDDDDRLLHYVHKGFEDVVFRSLLPYYENGGNDIQSYKNRVFQLQDDFKARYLKKQRSTKKRFSKYDDAYDRKSSKDRDSKDCDSKSSSRDIPYCKKWPQCAGKHFHKDCLIIQAEESADRGKDKEKDKNKAGRKDYKDYKDTKPSEKSTRSGRAYYGHDSESSHSSDSDDSFEYCNMATMVSDAEYERMQAGLNAYFVPSAASVKLPPVPLNSVSPVETISVRDPVFHYYAVCHRPFSSNNSLHNHIRQSKHFKKKPKVGLVLDDVRVYRSEFLDNHWYPDSLDHLTAFNYMSVATQFKPGKTDEMCLTSILDTGYGNSGVARKIIEHIQESYTGNTVELIDLPRARIITGLGGAQTTISQVALFDLYFHTIDGAYAHMRRPLGVFEDLPYSILLGNDVLATEGFLLDPTKKLVDVRSCHDPGGEPARLSVEINRRRVVRGKPVRAFKSIIVPAWSSVILGINQLHLPLEDPADDTYRFVPGSDTLKLHGVKKLPVDSGSPHGLVTYDQSCLVYTNFGDKNVKISRVQVLGTVHSVRDVAYHAWIVRSDPAPSRDVTAYQAESGPPPCQTYRTRACVGG
ncbi:hypothetical protein BJ508DRAFT_327484 [Ascobolus immersus RN42]|uniref:C2H2-type domain-containing protein n=1 Tax=Ascobolus immersus RN42 TaxID=1160509 RepID=A0A3N4I2P6_ASCIM|nr:hypothetical protein BJ508DRAFT_327484 [Ascobolus immersus RN42]